MTRPNGTEIDRAAASGLTHRRPVLPPTEPNAPHD